MIFQVRRLYCRLVHRGEFLRPSILGRGWQCIACPAGFVDLTDAGRLLIDPLELHLSPARHVLLERAPEEEPTFQAGTFRLLKGRSVVKVGTFRGAA
jgi:hypothetical protein